MSTKLGVTGNQPRSQGLSSLPPLVVGRKTLVAAGHVIIRPFKTAGWVGTQANLVEGTKEYHPGEGEVEQLCFKMALEFLSCVQKALLSAGYDDITLKVKQVICLESLYLKKDLVAVLPTGYGKSLVFQVLPRLLREREERNTCATTLVTKSVVLVVSPLNPLM